MRVREVLAAVAELPKHWSIYAVFRSVGVVELRRVVTDHGSVVVFSHEQNADGSAIIVVRWVAQGNQRRQQPPLRSVKPAARTRLIRPPE